MLSNLPPCLTSPVCLHSIYRCIAVFLLNVLEKDVGRTDWDHSGSILRSTMGAHWMYFEWCFTRHHSGISGQHIWETAHSVSPKTQVQQFYATRLPKDTRPLCLSNTDSKITALCINYRLSKLASVTVCQQQRGFIPCRQLADNIFEVEAHGIINAAASEYSPGIMLFDFRAAFPSL